jgi:hypothetical protein
LQAGNISFFKTIYEAIALRAEHLKPLLDEVLLAKVSEITDYTLKHPKTEVLF